MPTRKVRRSPCTMTYAKGAATNRSQFFKNMTVPFYGFNRPGAKVIEGLYELFADGHAG